MGSSKDEDEPPLDLKSLLSLSPMFPTPPGHTSTHPPLVYSRPSDFIKGSSKDKAETDEQPLPLDLKSLLSLSPMFPTPPGHTSTHPPLVYSRPKEFIIGSSKDESETDEPPLDLKPLLSLLPLFPTPPGYDVSSQSDNPQSVYITPISRPCSLSEHPRPAPASFAQAPPVPTAPLNIIPISVKFPTPQHKDKSSDDGSDEDYIPYGNKRKPPLLKRTTKKARQAAGSSATGIKQRPVRRNLNKELVGWRTSSENPRELVEETMTMFDSLRRCKLQLAEEGSSKRTDLQASALMKQNNLWINNVKKIGPVPGVKVGDIFFYRMEMSILGLHLPTRAEIDYLPATHVGEDGSRVVSIISFDGYGNDEDDTDTLIYTGQGGKIWCKEKHDQKPRSCKEKRDQKLRSCKEKLDRGTLALLNSAEQKNPIRVVRGVEDPSINSGKVYIYDGIYHIEYSWMDRVAKSDYGVYKYRLRREPGQPDVTSVWKITEKWKADPASRGKKVIELDLSSWVENLPVCLVNDVDDEERRPSDFEYVTGVKYSRPLSVCLPGDTNSSCVQQNCGDLPYSSSWVLAKHVAMLYECSSDCHCSRDCRNRVAQKGVQLNLEVFWTGDRGWGLRSCNPIRAGTFVCEYAGEVIDETNMNKDVEVDDYTFRASFPNDRTLRHNMGAELLEETSTQGTAESFKQLPIVISAKDAGNVARFINHSCSPNLLWQTVQYDHGDDCYPHIMFFAMKHIPPMTELTYDYGMRGAPPGINDKLPEDCKLKPCLCRSKNCRSSF